VPATRISRLDDSAHTDTARFEALLDRADTGRGAALTFDEWRELARLYRLHTTRLARLREHGDDPAAIRHVNALCVRGYGLLYATHARTGAPAAPLATRLARTLAITWPAIAVAAALLLGGMVVGAAVVTHNPDGVYALIPAELGYSTEHLDRLTTSPAARRELLTGAGIGAGHTLFLGSYLFVHNTRVGLLAFATGVLAGIPTVLLQLYNGILLGAFATLFWHEASLRFVAWILPHAIPELTAITLCAAGGLLLGGAIALPGRRRRVEALQEAARAAVLLVGAALPLFVLAAAIESGVRESTVGVPVRLLLAAALATGVAVGALWLRQLARRRQRDTSWLREESGTAGR